MMYRTFSATLFLLLSVTTASPAFASAADDIVRLLKYDSYYDSIAAAAIAHIVHTLEKEGKISSDRGLELAGQLQNDANDYRPVFLGQIAQYFQSNFNSGDLDDIRDFYQTHAGRRLNEVQKDLRDRIGTSSEQFGLALGADAAQHLRDEP